MNKYEFGGNFEKEIMKKADEIIMRGDVFHITEDESQVYTAEIKAQNGEPINTMSSIEMDEQGEIIDFYCNCHNMNP